MKNINNKILRSLFILNCLFVVSTSHSQTSFIEDFSMQYELREVESVVELLNGNFCTIVREDDMSLASSRIQGVYLFDACGKFIERIQFLNTDDYVDFNNVTVFQGNILVSGWTSGTEYFMMLDPDDMSVILEKKILGYILKDQIVNQDDSGFGYIGVWSDFINYARFDEELGRVIQKEVTLTDDDLSWISFSHATENHIFYKKTFDDYHYHEIGIADYDLTEIATIKGASIHGSIRFGELIFANDSTFYTTAVYELDEGLYYRKYELDSMVFEIAIEPESRIGQGIWYEAMDGKLNVLYSDKSYRIYDFETANLVSETSILIESSEPQNTTGVIRTMDNGLLIVDDYWMYIDNVWQSYIRLIKLNSDMELDFSSPCTVSTEDIARDDLMMKIGSNPNSGSFSLISHEKLSSVKLYSVEGNKLDATIEFNTGYNCQISTEVKGLVIVVARTDKGAQTTKKVIIY
ncbi:MAG: hypothetical protein ACI86M_003253 [Saprospiraceae bacterium]|jgi:hypothetical protein